MEMKLELVPVPVVDVDDAKRVYVEVVGFGVDRDVAPADGVRIVQFTPPGSSCSIVLAEGLPGLAGEPGSVRDLHLVVDDIAGDRRALVDHGVVVEEIAALGGGVRMAGFADPDGNTWALQELAQRRGHSS